MTKHEQRCATDSGDIVVSLSGREDCGFGGEGDRPGRSACYRETYVLSIGDWRADIVFTYDFALRQSSLALAGHPGKAWQGRRRRLAAARKVPVTV